jgi:hypothetical protein
LTVKRDADSLLKEVDSSLRSLGVPEAARRAFKALASDRHGYETGSAPSFISSRTSLSAEGARDALLELSDAGLIRTEDCADGRKRWFADFAPLNLEGDDIETITEGLTPPFEDCSEPHSPRAMSTLEALFENTEVTLYLSMEVTSPTVFKDMLVRRTETGRKTWFLMPKKADVTDGHKGHYDAL